MKTIPMTLTLKQFMLKAEVLKLYRKTLRLAKPLDRKLVDCAQYTSSIQCLYVFIMSSSLFHIFLVRESARQRSRIRTC